MNLRASFTWALAVLASAASICAQAEYPDKPIRFIVPWAAGGSTDVTTRVLAKAAERNLGQPIVVVNVPGASTMIGMTKLSREAPDGYTIGSLSSSAYIFEMSGQKVPYDTVHGFTYVSYVGDNLIGIAVLKGSPFKTMADLIAESKKRRLTYGTAGVYSTQSLIGFALQKETGGQIENIPMNGSAGSLNALLGRQVDFIIETSVWQQFVANGQIRLLAVSTEDRSKHYPNVPTLRELKLPSLRSVQAIIAPPGLPEPIRVKLESAFRKAMVDPAFVEIMDRMSMDAIDMSGKDAQAVVAREYDKAKGFAAAVGWVAQ